MASAVRRSSPTFVAFDLGGVLVDVDTTILARRLARPMADIEQAFFGNGRHDALSTGDLDDEEFVAAAAAVLGVDTSAARSAWAHVVQVRPGAADIVDRVAVDVIAWSNTDAVHVSQMAPSLPERLFRREARAFSHEIRAAKPDARFFRIALERIAAAPTDLLFVDDRPDNVEAARAVGVDAHVVQSLADVGSLLMERGLLSPGRAVGPGPR
jgi:HAD superfamily hydrolase (TIGR01509 family)